MIKLEQKAPEHVDVDLDTRGMNCPLPILKAKKALNDMDNGQIIHVITSDPLALLDFKSFCVHAAHNLIFIQENNDDECEFYIEKKPRGG